MAVSEQIMHFTTLHAIKYLIHKQTTNLVIYTIRHGAFTTSDTEAQSTVTTM